MLITLKKSAQSKAVTKLLEKHLISHHVCALDGKTIIGLESNPNPSLLQEIIRIEAVEKAEPMATPFKLVSRAFQSEDTVLDINGVKIGGKHIVMMAGPCAIESKEQLETISKELKKSGVQILRGSAFKPRSSPYSFQGMGHEGLKIHKEAQQLHGLLIETEVMDVRDVALAAEHVDILRIGARNMQNFDLLKEVAKTNKPVILKRGMSATIEEWLLSAEYIMAHGNSKVILCERGIRTFERSTRSTLDLSSIPIVKKLSHLPVIVDPSHAAGRNDLIPALSKAAVAAGADGLLIEVHPDPKIAKCDGAQALLPHELAALILDLRRIAEAEGRSL